MDDLIGLLQIQISPFCLKQILVLKETSILKLMKINVEIYSPILHLILFILFLFFHLKCNYNPIKIHLLLF